MSPKFVQLNSNEVTNNRLHWSVEILRTSLQYIIQRKEEEKTNDPKDVRWGKMRI